MKQVFFKALMVVAVLGSVSTSFANNDPNDITTAAGREFKQTQNAGCPLAKNGSSGTLAKQEHVAAATPASARGVSKDVVQ